MASPQGAVLVIDDEAHIRRFVRTGFELEGFAVREAENASAGLRSATSRRKSASSSNASSTIPREPSSSCTRPTAGG